MMDLDLDQGLPDKLGWLSYRRDLLANISYFQDYNLVSSQHPESSDSLVKQVNSSFVDLLACIEEMRNEKAMLGCNLDSMVNILSSWESSLVSWANNESNIEDSMDCSLELSACNLDSMVSNLGLLPRMEVSVQNSWDYLVSSWEMLESIQAMLGCMRDLLVSKDLLANMMRSSRDLSLDIWDLLANNLDSMVNMSSMASSLVKSS